MMPWRTKKKVYLSILASISLALAIIVLVRHESVDTDLLAVIGILGGIAILIVSLPDNGNNHKINEDK